MNAIEYCRTAAQAALAKQAEDVVILELAQGSGLADGFTIATGKNQRQVVAIVDAIEVTSSSRIASSGGLVTWAKSCAK